MAEGWTRFLKGDLYEPYSAGIEKHGLNPNAVKVMSEAGVDISNQHSKRVDELGNIRFDLVVTVCGHANENCPYFPNPRKVVHVGFDDPPKLAAGCDNDEAKLNCYRKVRDEIREFVSNIDEYMKGI